MSEVDQIDNVMTLEDLFLSAEFGKTVVEESTPVIEPLFWETSPGAPLLPLAAFPSTTGTHGTTTHMRRNRAFATASGVAAVLLVAVGCAVRHRKASEELRWTPRAEPPPQRRMLPATKQVAAAVAVVVAERACLPVASQSPTGFAPECSYNLDHVRSTSRVAERAIRPNRRGQWRTHTGGTGTAGTGTTTPSTPSATAPSGTILSPVISLLGHVVVPVGNTVTGLGGTLTTALPPLAPVTSIVSGLGNTLSLLGNNLIVSAA